MTTVCEEEEESLKRRELLVHDAEISIAVLGDICLDEYYFIDSEHADISVETGLETLAVKKATYDLGGAGNVAVNCRRLGAKRVDMYGIIGSDYAGMIVKDLFAKERIGVSGVYVQDENWSTHVYHKVYKNGIELPRYDIGNFNVAEAEITDRLLDLFEENLSSYDTVIINEQVLHGLHSRRFQERLNGIIQSHAHDVIWLTDCRNLNGIYRDTIHKLNNYEATDLFSRYHDTALKDSQDRSYRRLIEWLYEHWNNPVVMTLGQDGALVHDGDSVYTVLGLHIIQQIDTVGAGDGFLAGLAVTLSSGASLTEAAEIGNFAAGVCVRQLFKTGHPSIEEVNQMAEDADYRYNPELAEDVRLARYLEDTEIEIVGINLHGKFSGSYPEIAIFDHDGTISTLRQGWEEVMQEMMIKSILGTWYSHLPQQELASVKDQVAALIEKTTGVQTLIQMHELVKLIEIHGYVPSREIRTPLEYKEIYNEMLLRRVALREKRFTSGLLCLEDLTIKHAIRFLRELERHGTRLYLASGTDQEDVRREAELLGYADLFKGGIYGSVGDITRDPKRVVIQTILKEIETNTEVDPEQCVVFGDGPVEIREARKHSIPAVGVLSDERRRFGANMEKRNRLILAGADLLIPDFSWMPYLKEWMGWST